MIVYFLIIVKIITKGLKLKKDIKMSWNFLNIGNDRIVSFCQYRLHFNHNLGVHRSVRTLLYCLMSKVFSNHNIFLSEITSPLATERSICLLPWVLSPHHHFPGQ